MLDNVVHKAYTIYMNEKQSVDASEVWEWLQIGIDKGWVTEPFCYTHDGDPCAPVIKILV